MATQFFSEELVYSKGISSHGNYKYLRIVPIGSGQNPILSVSSTTQTQFELPNNVLNLSRSKLCFDLLVPLQFSLTKFSNIYGNALSLIDRITLTSRTGVILCDIPNTHIFGNLVSPVNTKLPDLLSRNTLGGGITMAQAAAVTADTSATAAATLAANVSVLGLSPIAPVNDITRCGGLLNQQTSAGTYSANAYTPYTEVTNMYLAPIVAASKAISSN